MVRNVEGRVVRTAGVRPGVELPPLSTALPRDSPGEDLPVAPVVARVCSNGESWGRGQRHAGARPARLPRQRSHGPALARATRSETPVAAAPPRVFGTCPSPGLKSGSGAASSKPSQSGRERQKAKDRGHRWADPGSGSTPSGQEEQGARFAPAAGACKLRPPDRDPQVEPRNRPRSRYEPRSRESPRRGSGPILDPECGDR